MAMNQSNLNKFIKAAKAAGCPRDQIENFIRAGYVPQPKQLEFHAAARQADTHGNPNRIALGGARGPGKSHGIFAQMALDDCQRVDNLKMLFLRRVGRSASESFEDLVGRVCRHVEHEYIPTRGRIVFGNGSKILFGGFQSERDIDKYIGIEYDGIAPEDATTLSKNKIDMLEGSLRTSKQDWIPRSYFSANPGGVGHAWFKNVFVKPMREGREIDTRFIFSTYRDNKFLNPEYVRYLEGLGGWLGKAWRDGDWDIAAGQCFTNWNHDKHVIAPEHVPAKLDYWLSLDYGFTHYTVVYLLGEDGDGNVYLIDEHAERKMLPPTHVERIKAMLVRNKVEDIPLCFAGRDVFATRGTTKTIAEQYEELGLPLRPAQDDRINGAAKILQMLGDDEQGIEQKLFISSKCAGLIECIPSMEHDPHRPEDVLKVDTDDDGNGGDDYYDGARYGIMEAGNKMKIETTTNPFYN